MEEGRLKPPFERRAYRVSRGGSWGSASQYARVADRGSFDPGFRYDYLGFRLARNTDREGERDEKEN
jgi:formylglycine-generating enzyme required for sulfatase activity